MSARCSRIWEVEASRDGRLQGSALEAHRQHVASCASCRAETRALDLLAERSKAVGDGPVDQIALRRARREILARADGMLSGRVVPASRERARAFSVVFAAAALLVGLALWWGWSRSAQAPRVVVEATAGASAHWQRTAEPEVERFRLEDGVLSLHVQRDPGSRRVVVEVPDGQIEDIGTVFRVEVSHAHTDRVAVEEGIVRVRLRDGLDVTLHSGEQWSRSKEIDSKPGEAPPASARVQPAVPVPEPPPAGAAARSPAPLRVTASARTGVASSASAVDARPGDAANAEDDAYLDVLALLRAGRTDDARAAAQDYLVRFPQGFRRKEMAQVAAGKDL